MKPSQPLWRISILTALEAEDAASELLATVTGLSPVAYFDLESQVSYVSAFSETRPVSANLLQKLAAGLKQMKSFGLDTGRAKLTISRVRREDWAESWKRHFKPIVIEAPHRRSNRGSASLLVKPSWSTKPPKKGQAVVTLDPGLSFGTGQHPTTSFCLHEIVRRANTGLPASFLDIGTGSGILAIAAAKLGYQPVEAFDFDPDSVRVAKTNLEANGVSARVMLTRGDITKVPLKPARQFDLVCANLISTLLISERRRLARRVQPGGTLVVAGILAEEFSEVVQAFADVKLKLGVSRREKEWRSGAFCFE